MKVAVVAHARKKLGGGLPELRQVLARSGLRKLLWYEVPKSRKARKAARRALKKGARLILVWGGDGMVQRCIDAVSGTDVPVAILPAGTANLLASNLGIPRDVAKAVDIALHGERRKLDVGVMNKERFAVMAGTGFDAIMIRHAAGRAKTRLGRLAYARSSVKAMRAPRVQMRVRIDDQPWFAGKASCLLFGNVGKVTGGLPVFAEASPSDGVLEVGLVTARNAWQWVRVLARVARGRIDRSPLIKTTRARRVRVELGRKMPYQLDGGDRPPVRRLKVRVEPAAVTVCVPAAQAAAGARSSAARPPRTGAAGRPEGSPSSSGSPPRSPPGPR
jgi:YegS/Rv2252/BmrU family lipid kinase